MRRREKVEGLPPQRLRRYVAEEWDHAPQAWYDAQEAWLAEHPGEALDVEGPMPDVPFDPSLI